MIVRNFGRGCRLTLKALRSWGLIFPNPWLITDCKSTKKSLNWWLNPQFLKTHVGRCLFFFVQTLILFDYLFVFVSLWLLNAYLLFVIVSFWRIIVSCRFIKVTFRYVKVIYFCVIVIYFYVIVILYYAIVKLWWLKVDLCFIIVTLFLIIVKNWLIKVKVRLHFYFLFCLFYFYELQFHDCFIIWFGWCSEWF